MPKRHGARLERVNQAQRDRRCSVPSIVTDGERRIDFGPSRRDPQGSLPEQTTSSALQRASAMGSAAVSPSRAARRVQPYRLPLGSPNGTAMGLGVSVAARSAHANRAYVRSSHESGTYAPNHSRGHATRQCSLQNVTDESVHGVHG